MAVVGLNTLNLNTTGPGLNSSPFRPHKKRVFTEDEYKFLLTCTNEDLLRRIKQGRSLIEMLKRPEMLNMTPKSAAYYSSNLNYQIDEIRNIIKSRGVEL